MAILDFSSNAKERPRKGSFLAENSEGTPGKKIISYLGIMRISSCFGERYTVSCEKYRVYESREPGSEYIVGPFGITPVWAIMLLDV